jgi:hypothetical protein
LFVLVIPGKYRGTCCHLFLPQLTNSSFTKYDSPLQQYTAPFITSELKYTQHYTLYNDAVACDSETQVRRKKKTVLVRSQLQIIPNRKELNSFSPLLPRQILQRSLCSQAAMRGFVDSKSRFRVQLDIL